MWGRDVGSPRSKVPAWGTPCAGQGLGVNGSWYPSTGGASVSPPVNWAQWQHLCGPLRAPGGSVGQLQKSLAGTCLWNP